MSGSSTHRARTYDGFDPVYRVIGDGAVDLFWSFNQLPCIASAVAGGAIYAAFAAAHPDRIAGTEHFAAA